MVIYEHVKGILSVPCYLDNGDYAEYTTDIAFTDSDIIRNSCSIKSSACDSSTFSLGSVRPAELSIQLHLEQDGINAYNLYGAKIILYSCYQKEPKPSDWIFRGMFWVTSVSRKKTLYTLRASDALVWLNNNSISSGSGKVDDDESEVSKKLREKLEGYEGEAGGGGVYSLHEIVTNVVTWTNDILQNMIAEKPLAYEHINSIPNDNPKLGNSYSGYTLMRNQKKENPEIPDTVLLIISLPLQSRLVPLFVCEMTSIRTMIHKCLFLLSHLAFLKTKYLFRFLPLQEIAVMWHRITSIFKRSILKPMMILDGQMQGNTSQCWEMQKSTCPAIAFLMEEEWKRF